MWTPAKDNVVIKPRRDIQTAKFMFTVIWQSLGFHIIDRLPAGARINGEYFTINILARLEEKIVPERRTADAKGWLFTWTTVRSTQAEPQNIA
jgi:hypothetical protein